MAKSYMFADGRKVTRVDQLEFSVRTHNVLTNFSITTIEDLMKLDREQVESLRHMGSKGTREVFEVLALLTLCNEEPPTVDRSQAILLQFEIFKARAKQTELNIMAGVYKTRVVYKGTYPDGPRANEQELLAMEVATHQNHIDRMQDCFEAYCEAMPKET